MGAIFGWLGDPRSASIDHMHARLRHRAPRIAVAEPSCGGQLAAAEGDEGPRLAVRGACVLAFDGRLYGGALGASPAEALLELYRDHGVGFLQLIDGDFALALWDGERRRLVLARDPNGARPLYWTRLLDGAIAFASEYKALLTAPGFDTAIDREMLQRLQEEKYLPSERTLFRAVHGIAPGAAVAIEGTGGTSRLLAHVPPPPLDLQPDSAAACARRVERALYAAVDKRVRSARRAGIALSGGIDSMSVAFAVRAQAGRPPLRTFTASGGAGDPDATRAAQVAARLGTRHLELEVTPERLASVLPRVVWHLEDPIARTETVQFYELARVARRSVDLMLTGAGADTLFAGMQSYKILQLYAWLPPLRAGLHELYALLRAGRAPRSIEGRVLERLCFGAPLPPVARIVGAEPPNSSRALPAVSAEFLNVHLHALYQEGTAQFLPKFERMLAAFGVEFASPFLDREVIRTAFTIPAALKMRRLRGKHVLREALRSAMGDSFAGAPKAPMRMRCDSRFDATLEALSDTWLAPDRVRARGLFEPQSITALLHGWRRCRHPEAAMRVWTALATEMWAHQFLDRRGEAPAEMLGTIAPTHSSGGHLGEEPALQPAGSYPHGGTQN